MSGKKKFIYGGVIGVGLIALLVDRFSGAGPEATPQSAAASQTKRIRAVPATAPQPAKATVRVTAAPFPRTLLAGPPPEAMRDLFALSGPAVEALTRPREVLDATSSGLPELAAAGPSYTEQFVTDHKLSAVVVSGDGSLAVVDGQLVRVGQTVDGCVLRSITGQTAVFECPGGSATLSVDSVP